MWAKDDEEEQACERRVEQGQREVAVVHSGVIKGREGEGRWKGGKDN